MSERLIIRLASQSHLPISWLVYNHDGDEIIASGQLNNVDELSQITSQAVNRNVSVLVPGDEINYFEVELPKANRRQAIKAIPYMLEDDLASPVEALHFVYGKIADDRQGVYVCDKRKIEQWLEALSAAQISVQVMLPDYLCLPLPEPNTISVLQFEQSILIHLDAVQGQTFDKSWLEPILNEMTGDERLQLHHFGVDSELMFDCADWQEQQLLLPIEQLAQGCQKLKTNLLVGEYVQNKTEYNHWKIWRTAACVAGIALVAFFGDMYIETQQLEKQRLALKAQSDSIYRQLNPGIKRVRMVKKQMTSQLAALNGGLKNNDMLEMLVALNDAFKQVPELTLITIKFDQKRREVRLQADAKDYQQFDTFKQLLSDQYNVVTGAINNNGSKVNGSLTIKATS